LDVKWKDDIGVCYYCFILFYSATLIISDFETSNGRMRREQQIKNVLVAVVAYLVRGSNLEFV
jgi:hypothetical protein